MICPKCHAEYQPGFTRCADCDVALVTTLPEAAPRQRRHAAERRPSAEPGERAAGRRPSAEPGAPVSGSHPSADLPDLVTMLASGDPGLVAVAKSVLGSAGIPWMVEGEGIQNLFGIGRLAGGFNPISGPVRLRVLAADAEDARLLLADLSPRP
jgi:Putative prokaryotic signal transducing protein